MRTFAVHVRLFCTLCDLLSLQSSNPFVSAIFPPKKLLDADKTQEKRSSSWHSNTRRHCNIKSVYSKCKWGDIHQIHSCTETRAALAAVIRCTSLHRAFLHRNSVVFLRAHNHSWTNLINKAWIKNILCVWEISD